MSTSFIAILRDRPGRRPAFGSPAAALRDLDAFPILTEEVGYPPSPLSQPSTGTGGGALKGGSLGQVAASAVADVLGWKLKAGDPKGFVGALTQAFNLTESEGHVTASWIPRTYAVQSDLSGGISGAQASLYARAQDALTQSLPLLNGLYALKPDADQEDVEALREVVRDQMTQLVNELAYSGGPRVQRVNQYFTLLLGIVPTVPAAVVTDSDAIPGSSTLGNLREVFGVYTQRGGQGGPSNPWVNTLEDEQDATNFRILADYLTSLAITWANNYQFFGLNSTLPFLGTQLVLISRQLSVVAELVNEVRFTLDSVFIGPAERQTLQLPLPTPIMMEDLLVWIYSLVSDEAPGVIQSGGKFGAYQIAQVVETLQGQVYAAINLPPGILGIPPGFFTARVQRSMRTLNDQLIELNALALAVGKSKLV
jgi:hypothetical protein